MIGLLGGIWTGIEKMSIREFHEINTIGVKSGFIIPLLAYEIGKEKDRFEKLINTGSINKSNPEELYGSIGSFVNLNQLTNRKEYVYLYNSYDHNFNYKIKASFNKSTNEFYAYPPVGNKIYTSIYKYGKYINENIIS